MEISALTFSMEDYDIFYGIPWKSSMQFHRNYSIDYSMDLQGVSWNDQFGELNVVPNSNPLGIKRFVSGISISFKFECHIIMQIQYTKNLTTGDLNWVQH